MYVIDYINYICIMYSYQTKYLYILHKTRKVENMKKPFWDRVFFYLFYN